MSKFTYITHQILFNSFWKKKKKSKKKAKKKKIKLGIVFHFFFHKKDKLIAENDKVETFGKLIIILLKQFLQIFIPIFIINFHSLTTVFFFFTISNSFFFG